MTGVTKKTLPCLLIASIVAANILWMCMCFVSYASCGCWKEGCYNLQPAEKVDLLCHLLLLMSVVLRTSVVSVMLVISV